MDEHDRKAIARIMDERHDRTVAAVTAAVETTTIDIAKLGGVMLDMLKRLDALEATLMLKRLDALEATLAAVEDDAPSVEVVIGDLRYKT